MTTPLSALILIVDDDVELAQMLQRYLSSEGLTTIHAGTGGEAAPLGWQRGLGGSGP